MPKVDKDYSLYRTYVIFRTLGLRHLVVVNVHNHVVGIITRKDLMPFKMQERLEALLEQNTTLTPDAEYELNGEVPKDSADSRKGSSKRARSRSSDAISNHSGDVTPPILSRTSSINTNKVALSGKEDDTHSIQSSVRSSSHSISSAATEVCDNDPERSDGATLTQIVVTVSPPSDDTPDSES